MIDSQPISRQPKREATDVASFVAIINAKVLTRWNTLLRGHFPEPFYAPATLSDPAEIQFRGESIRSAMHELAHWCVAGEERRKCADYGYWYRPDGRDAAEQEEFFSLEVKPQAIEKAFAEACGVEFTVSCDNLNGAQLDPSDFSRAVDAQLHVYRQTGFPQRTQQILQVLDECVSATAVTNVPPIQSQQEALLLSESP